MAIIYTYPIVTPTSNDLVLGTDVDAQGKPTKNFTVKSIIDLATVSGNDLQAVLDNGNSATQNIILTGNISATRYTDGTMVIAGGVGSGFTSLTSVDFIGDITGILKAGSSIQSTVTGVTQPLGTNNTTLATTAFVMSKVDPSVLQYLGDATGPFDLNLVTDDFKISGTANQIETTATTVGGNVGAINLKFPTTGVTLPNGSIATTQALTDDSTKVATTAFVQGKNVAQTLEFDGDTGTSTVLLNSQILGIEGTLNQITTAVSAQRVKLSLPTNVEITGVFEGTTFVGDLNGTVNTATTGTTQAADDNSTKIATTEYVDSAAGSKTLSYKDTSATINTMNLADDDLQFTGGSNITSTATAVATNIADIKFDLDDSVTISGTMNADKFETTAGTATWVTTVLDGFTAITSDLFTGPLTGNASTATALASSGAIAITGDTTSTGGPYTYTSGGAISIATTIADTTVTAKVLTNLATPTSSAIAATDTILAAMAKLQGQIEGIAGSLAFEGTWDARTVAEGGAGTPPSATPANGQFWIVSVAGSQDLSGITDWLVGDWAIYVSNGAGTDAWQKLDQSNEVLGSGAANKIAKWTSTNTLATGIIDDDGTTVTVGNSGNLIVEGNTTLGDADTDTTTVKGPAIFEFATRFNEGISLGAATYGTAGQVLTSGGGSASVNTWTTPTTGVVESISGGAGIIVSGTSAIPIVSVDYLGTDNIILSAGTAVTPVGADTIIINDATTGNVVKALISNLPFNSYSWNIEADAGTGSPYTVANGNTIDFVGVGNVSTAWDDATKELRISASSDPGTGTQYTLPVWSTTTSLGDSMVSQNAGATELTIAGDVTTSGDIELNGANKYIYLRTGTNSGLWQEDNFSLRFGTNNDEALELDNLQNATFAGHVDAGTGIRIKTDTDAVIESIVADKDILLKGTDNATAITALKLDMSEAGDATFNRSITLPYRINFDDNAAGNSVRGRISGSATNGLQLRGSSSGTYSSGPRGLNINNGYSLFQGEVIGTGTSPNPSIDVVTIESDVSTSGTGATVLKIGDTTNFAAGYLANSTFYGNVDIKGELNVDGGIDIRGFTFDGVAKAITVADGFQDMFSLQLNGPAVIADILAACGVSGTNSGRQSMAYKVAQGGATSGTANAAVYNKIIDTGGDDFELQFSAIGSGNTFGFKCQAKALTATRTISLSVQYKSGATFADLT